MLDDQEKCTHVEDGRAASPHDQFLVRLDFCGILVHPLHHGHFLQSHHECDDDVRQYPRQEELLV